MKKYEKNQIDVMDRGEKERSTQQKRQMHKNEEEEEELGL